MEQVMEVVSGTATYFGKKPSTLVIHSVGKVPSSGWTNPQLSPRFYIVAPSDGVQDFDFYATPPTGISLPIVLPIVAEAAAQLDVDNYWGQGKPLKGVRIHARKNDIEVPLEEKSEMSPMAEGLPVPWPFPWRTITKAGGGELPFPFRFADLAPTNQGAHDLVGMKLRVYHTGDMLTQDYVRDRANIELNPTSERIVSVWVG